MSARARASQRGGSIGHQPSLTLKRGLFPNQLFQPPVQGLHQKSPLWSVEMISVIGCWSVRQNGVNMASGTATVAPSTATTAPSTTPLPLTAGPSTIEPIVPIVAPLGAQDTPSVIQRARPVVSTEQTMQSTAVYGPLPYCRIRHPCRMLPCLLCQQGLLNQWVIMVRAISSLFCLTPIGCL